MEMPIGEIFDRFTIVELKKRRLSNSDSLSRQLEVYKNEVDRLINDLDVQRQKIARNYIQQLIQINASIWDLEHDIRAGLEGTMPLEEVGRRAIKIRDFNGRRMRTKNLIYDLFNQQEFKDVKIDHISETK